MRTQQAFFKNRPQNLKVINSNFNNNNTYKNNYNNSISLDKYNALYIRNYNNNRKNYNELNNYSNRQINNEKDYKYYLKSQNYFSKDYKSINTIHRNNKDYTVSTNKSQNRTNIHFYLSKNKIKNNLSTLPAIKAGHITRNNKNENKNIIYDNNYSNKYNNTYQNINSNSKFNNIKSIRPIQNINNLNNNQCFKSSNYSPPKKINLFKIKPYNNENKINHPPSLNFLLKEKFLLYKNAKFSENSFNLISAYGVNTYKGIIRNYNEDRISIIINAKYCNIQKLKNNNSEKVSFFAIYDGHAGNKCCEFLKTNLHNYIFESDFFPNDPIKAIEQGFTICEQKFNESIRTKENKIINKKFRNRYNNFSDYSGSCAIIILIINNVCYTINLGDSRALYSYDSGNKFYQLSRDHKPNDKIEKERIYKAGGSIFKTNIEQYGIELKESELGFKIPFRILPGRLAVSKYIFIFNYRLQELLEILMQKTPH